jgi:hypothetical protein
MPPKRQGQRSKRGSGIIDRLVDVLPFELHLPGKKMLSIGDGYITKIVA